jgi:hypothetical protein
MTNLISRRWTTVLLILIPLIVLSACLSLAGSSPAPTPEPGGILVQGNVIFGPGSFNYLRPAAGLSDLSSYRATLSVSFDGMEAGQPRQWSKTYVMLTTMKPLARQVTIEKSGQVSDPEPVFMAEVDGAAYERHGTHPCTVTAIVPEDSLAEQMEPAGFLSGVIGAEGVGIETVNGVAANHYTFDERALGQLGFAKSTGELWVALGGGYVVKYVLTTQGGADYFGAGVEGRATWNYRLTNVNQPLAIELPKDCPAGGVGAPLLPDAADAVSMPGRLLIYTTATSVADAAAFYRQELAALGWQQMANPVLGETLTLLDFTYADHQLSVIITTGDGGTTVHIVVGVER